MDGERSTCEKRYLSDTSMYTRRDRVISFMYIYLVCKPSGHIVIHTTYYTYFVQASELTVNAI